jgi:hypothetical protein
MAGHALRFRRRPLAGQTFRLRCPAWPGSHRILARSVRSSRPDLQTELRHGRLRAHVTAVVRVFRFRETQRPTVALAKVVRPASVGGHPRTDGHWPRAESVLYRLLNVVDHDHTPLFLRGLELQPELFLDGGEDGRGIGQHGVCGAGRSADRRFWSEFQNDILKFSNSQILKFSNSTSD